MERSEACLKGGIHKVQFETQGPPQNQQILWGEEEEMERSEACLKGGIHAVQFLPTTTR